MSAAVMGGDNDNNITISHKRGGGEDEAVAKAREVRPAKHWECMNRTRRRRGGEVMFDQ